MQPITITPPQSPSLDKIILDKITNNNSDTYIIFFKKSCQYCENALRVLRKSNVKYKGYNIDKINGNTDRLLRLFIKNKSTISFDPSHVTIPIIFYNGIYIGGYDKLLEHINHRILV